MQHALIIGSGGIASAIAQSLRQLNFSLAIASRNTTSGNDLAHQVSGDFFPVDASDASSMAELTAPVAAWSGGEPCAVVNTAGSILLKPAHLTSESEWHHTIAQNLSSAFYTVKLAAAVKNMQSVLLFSSAAAQLGLANHEAVAAAKAGVEGLVRSAATTYARRGLRVNALALGLVDTPLAQAITQRPAARQASEAMHPLGRIGTSDDVAAAAVQLLTATWATGAIWTLDGGLSQCRPH